MQLVQTLVKMTADGAETLSAVAQWRVGNTTVEGGYICL
jgi:hypothetical protein